MLKVYIHSRLNNKKWNPDGIIGLIGKSIEANKGENNSDLEELVCDIIDSLYGSFHNKITPSWIASLRQYRCPHTYLHSPLA